VWQFYHCSTFVSVLVIGVPNVSADTMKMVCNNCQRAELKDDCMHSNRPRNLSPLQPYFLCLLPPSLPSVLARTVSVLTDGKLNI
jgi:hypothetical protein